MAITDSTTINGVSRNNVIVSKSFSGTPALEVALLYDGALVFKVGSNTYRSNCLLDEPEGKALWDFIQANGV